MNRANSFAVRIQLSGGLNASNVDQPLLAGQDHHAMTADSAGLLGHLLGPDVPWPAIAHSAIDCHP